VRRFVTTCCIGLVLGAAPRGAAAPSEPVAPVAAAVHQLLVVLAPTWDSSSGTLQRYERNETSGWREVGTVIPVDLGRRGLAWGRGLHPEAGAGPLKHEGDARSPAGVFALQTAFGVAAGLPVGGHGFPYLQTTPSTYCVEDVRSPHYNELIDAAQVKRVGWQKWSPLRRADGLFRFGVVVRQNAADVVMGAGSCVFLHVWRGPHRPTVGCTAMASESIEEILRWLDPKAEPVLVQLPEPAYETVRAGWSLPERDATPSAKK
jgi:L,D-peptidoglycan transpeptidase YkuD (ErfK/YbiS/YcfS/YnhG family)